MTTFRKIAANTLVQIVGKAIGTLLGVVTIALITRHLGPAGFGQFTIVIAFLQVAATLADLGLNVMTVQLLAERELERNRIFGNLLAMRLVSAVVFLGGAVVVSWFFPYPTIVKVGIALASLSFLSIVLNQIFVGFFQDRLKTQFASLAEVVGRATLLVGTIIAVQVGVSVLAVLTALVVANAIQLLVSALLARKHVRIRLQWEFAWWRVALARAWPIGLSVALTLLYLRMDTVILSLYRDASEVGLYGAAYRVIDVFSQLPFLFVGVALPVLARLWKSGDRGEFNQLVQRSFDLLMAAVIPLAIGGFLLSKEVMTLVAGKEFSASGVYLAILLLALVFVFSSALFSYTIVAMNAQRRMVFGYGLSAVLTLIGYFIFIPKFGGLAAAWLTVFSEAIVALCAALVVVRRGVVRLSFVRMGKIIVASACMATVLALLRGFGLWPPLIGGVITYAVVLVALGGIQKSAVRELLKAA
ncbi:MAG: flippase [bacterium]|nr:flippase [bacterium]